MFNAIRGNEQFLGVPPESRGLWKTSDKQFYWSTVSTIWHSNSSPDRCGIGWEPPAGLIHFLCSRHVLSLSIPTGTNECVSAPPLAPQCTRFLHLYPPVRSALVCLHQVQRSVSRRHLRCHLLQVRVCSTRYWLTYSLMILPCVFLAGSSTSSVYGPKKRKAFPIGALLGFEPAVQVWPRLYSAGAKEYEEKRNSVGALSLNSFCRLIHVHLPCLRCLFIGDASVYSPIKASRKRQKLRMRGSVLEDLDGLSAAALEALLLENLVNL